MNKFSQYSRTFFTVILYLFIESLFAQEDWKLVRDDEGVKIYTMNENNFDFKTFKAHVVFETSIQSFISALNDVENLSDWGHRVKSSKLLEKQGDSVLIYYSVAKAPFPYKNRDGIYLNRYIWNNRKRTLVIDIEILEDYVEVNEKYVRVTGSGFWKIVELENEKIDVTFQMQANPGGSVPSWMANMFVTDSPYHTLINLREIIKEKKHQNKTIDYID